MKTVKLIIGIILLIVGIALYLLKTINPWFCLAIGVVGLILIILSFFCCKKKNLPAVTEAPTTSETSAPESETRSSEPVEVGSDTEQTPPAV
ncbi:hypothetical protein KKG58_00620 [Patescibacteria group bacterium]|nr:hypothetical protein [Patescibacteria group bacterium]